MAVAMAESCLYETPESGVLFNTPKIGVGMMIEKIENELSELQMSLLDAEVFVKIMRENKQMNGGAS